MRTNVFYVAAVEKRFFLLFPACYLVDAAAGIFVKRNMIFFDEFGIFILDVIGMILGGMFAALGVVITETVHDIETHEIVLGAHLVEAFLHRRIQIVPILICELQKPSHVIDSRDQFFSSFQPVFHAQIL